MGPANTLGYPYLPTKTLGGEFPTTSLRSTFLVRVASALYWIVRGQLDRPQIFLGGSQNGQIFLGADLLSKSLAMRNRLPRPSTTYLEMRDWPRS